MDEQRISRTDRIRRDVAAGIGVGNADVAFLLAEHDRLHAGVRALVGDSTPSLRGVMFGGEPFPVMVDADRLLALLAGGDAAAVNGTP